MLSAILFAAVTIAFPREGQRLPPLSHCYLIGATDGGEEVLGAWCQAADATNAVMVSRTGAWGTVVEVKPGTNMVCVGGICRSLFIESPRPAAVSDSGAKKIYGKLEYASDVARAHPFGKKPSEVTVVLDAGHGGADGGATSPHGRSESEANLLLTKEVAAAMSAKGFRIVLTRTNDVAVALYDRPKFAHAVGADAFISIHHNAPGYETDPSVTRWQAVYAWNPLGDRLASAISARMAAARPGLLSKGVLRANFAVTRNPEIPSCLIEADFITHPDGEATAWSAAARRTLAAAIADGVLDWLASPSCAGAEDVLQ